MENKRIRYFDWLRVVCMLGVVTIHVCNESRAGLSLGDPGFDVFFIYRSLVRWSVPVFVMISGALFLDPDRDVPTERLYSKNLFRLVVSFFLCSAAYLVYRTLFRTGVTGIRNTLSALVEGTYHMWFLPMIMGLYLITPLLRKIAGEREPLILFLSLSALFAVAFPTFETICKALLSIGAGKYVEFVYGVERIIVGRLNIHFVSGYVFYYMLGHLLHRWSPDDGWVAVIAALGILSVPITIAFSMHVSNATGVLNDELLGYLTLPSALQSMALFLVFKRRVSHDAASNETGDGLDVVRWVSDRSLGVYLFHVMVVWALKDFFGVSGMLFDPVACVPVVVILVALISLALVEALSRIPVLGRFVR